MFILDARYGDLQAHKGGWTGSTPPSADGCKSVLRHIKSYAGDDRRYSLFSRSSKILRVSHASKRLKQLPTREMPIVSGVKAPLEANDPQLSGHFDPIEIYLCTESPKGVSRPTSVCIWTWSINVIIKPQTSQNIIRHPR